MKLSQDDIDNFVNHAGYDDGLPFVQEFLKTNGNEVLSRPNHEGVTAFMRAAQFGKPAMMDYLSAAGAPVPKELDGMPYIVWMAGNGHEDGVKWLLAHGADPKASGGQENMTGLMHASMRDHRTGTIEALVNAGADCNAKDARGRTALFYAAMMTGGENVGTLIKAGAQVDAIDNQSETALHVAVLFANMKAINGFFDNGADIFAQDGKGVSCYDAGVKRGLSSVFETERLRRGEEAASLITQGSAAKITVKRLHLAPPKKS